MAGHPGYVHDSARIIRPRTYTADVNTARLEDVIRQDERVVMHASGTAVISLVWCGVRRCPLYVGQCKVFVRWVPRALIDDRKAQRVMCSLSSLQQNAENGSTFLRCIVTGMSAPHNA